MSVDLAMLRVPYYVVSSNNLPPTKPPNMPEKSIYVLRAPLKIKGKQKWLGQLEEKLTTNYKKRSYQINLSYCESFTLQNLCVSNIPHFVSTSVAFKMVLSFLLTFDSLWQIPWFARIFPPWAFNSVVSLISILVFWRLWRFTMLPILCPADAEELPYWIPCM